MPAPLIDLPESVQASDYDCGPALARSVLSYFGRPCFRVDETLRPCRDNGTPPERLAWLFLLNGLRIIAQSELGLRGLYAATANGWPVCCPIQLDGEGHWVGVRGMDSERVWLMDPASGYADMPIREFDARWHDATADGVLLRRFGLAVHTAA